MVFYQKKLSAKAIINKSKKEAIDFINTDEEIYTRMVMCILLNGDDFKSAEEIKADLKARHKTLVELYDKGFNSGSHNKFNEVQVKIYLIINGYDLKLFPAYVVSKAMKSINSALS